MKVFFTLDTVTIGGTEKSTLDIISNFSEDTNATVIYFYNKHELKSAFEKANIPLYYANLKTKKSYLAGVRYLIQLIKKQKPDIVVSSIASADLISRIACFITGTPIIGTLVNDTYGEIRIQEQRKSKNYIKFRYSWFLDRITAFVPKFWISNCKSIAFSNAKALGLNLNKVSVIYRGRTTNQFPLWQPPSDLKIIKFVFIGRLLERKGLFELLKVFKKLKEDHQPVHLDIFGGGPISATLQKYIDENQLQHIVTLHGITPNGWKKLYDGHCFLFPSWYEGFSGSLVEAMFAGIPIIASDILMNKEAVTDKKTALIFKVKDADDLLHKIKLMISNYPEMIEMGKRAREEAFQRFDIKIIAKQYEEFLKSIVNKKVDSSQLLQKGD